MTADGTMQLCRMSVRVCLAALFFCLTDPENIWRNALTVCHTLLIDFYVCALAIENFDKKMIDEHAPAALVCLFKVLMTTTSLLPIVENENFMSKVSHVTWCVICIAASSHSKLQVANFRWFFPAANAQFLITACLFRSDAEDDTIFVSRTCMFLALCIYLYAQPPQQGCLIKRRGYMICCLPVLMVDFFLAVAFTPIAIIAVTLSDRHSLKTSNRHQPLQTMDSDPETSEPASLI